MHFFNIMKCNHLIISSLAETCFPLKTKYRFNRFPIEGILDCLVDGLCGIKPDQLIERKKAFPIAIDEKGRNDWGWLSPETLSISV